MIYFDNNSTTRVFESTLEAMRPFFTENFANPASAIAQFGGIQKVIRAQKASLSKTLGANEADQFVITSGATESNNLALLGAARANPRRRHIVISAIEHPSVMEVSERLRIEGYRLSTLPVSRNGVVDTKSLSGLLCPDTLLVSVMLANNETGVVQPLGLLAGAVKKHDPEILVHTDATQAVGKIPIDLSGELADIDLLSLSAHKFHGPKGTGALFVRDADAIAPILYGGAQQNGFRAGTENPAGVVGMVTALLRLMALSPVLGDVEHLRNRLEAGILASHPDVFVLGAGAKRLPTTLNVCLSGIDAEDLVDRMATKNVAISAGSACSYGARKPSYVALAHGLSYDQALRCIRLSLSVESTNQEVDTFLQIFTEVMTCVTPENHRRETA